MLPWPHIRRTESNYPQSPLIPWPQVMSAAPDYFWEGAASGVVSPNCLLGCSITCPSKSCQFPVEAAGYKSFTARDPIIWLSLLPYYCSMLPFCLCMLVLSYPLNKACYWYRKYESLLCVRDTSRLSRSAAGSRYDLSSDCPCSLYVCVRTTHTNPHAIL